MTASLNGVNYQANFWTQGQNPSTNNGGPGSGAPWTIIETCSACTTVPSVPTGLQASGTTSNSTSLSWTASTGAVNCVLTGYTIFRNGVAVATSSSPNVSITGLSPLTTYSFRVAATDAAGSSAQSGVNILNSVKTSGLNLNVVNIMAMDYGSANDNGGQMGLSATQAASNTHNQVVAAGLTASIGVTPMIGINDVNTEIFQLSDAQMLLNFANQTATSLDSRCGP